MKQIFHTHFSGESLKAKVFRGGALMGLGSVAEQSVRFGRNMLLTRMLAPEAFGLMAMVLSAATLIQVLVDVGAREALVQNPKGSEEGHVVAAWWMTVGRSLSIYALVYVLAPFAARFYGHSELTALARVAILSIVFDGLMSPRAIVAQKEMKFAKVAAIDNGGSICGVLITVILSFYLRDVWALVLGFCSENAIRCILSFILCPFRPRIPSDLAPFRDLLRFSKGMVGLTLLNFIFTRTDIFVLAKLYSSAEIGLYSMAVYLVQTPITFLVRIMAQTLFPTFSHIQDDPERGNRILLKVISATMLLGLPALVFAVFCGHSLLTVVYGPRYGVAAIALVLAACAALINVLNAQLTMVFYAQGLPQLHRRAVAAMAVLVIVLTYPLTKEFGLWGAQLAILIAIVVGYVLQMERIRAVIGLKLSEYRKILVVPITISLCAVLACLAAKSVGILLRPLPNIIFGILGCLIATGVACAVFLREGNGIVQSEGASRPAYIEQP